ncbi:MAG: hypothetical protein SFU27_03150 [Thermonemataceae bacterium]|nr:hypothetical protein [Thermonemataceae bacterium]
MEIIPSIEPIESQEEKSSEAANTPHDKKEEKKYRLDIFEENLYRSENYQSGFWNGYFGLSKEHQEGYLSEKARFNILEDELKHAQEQLHHTKLSLQKYEEKYLEGFKNLSKVQQKIEHQNVIAQRRSEELKNTEELIGNYQKESKSLRNNNSFLGGILFLVAAFIFIAGDLVISHEIVAYALNIKNNLEAWSFAVGLATVSVLLKPAYDRLIEYPYYKDVNKQAKLIYVVFKIFIVIFTIITLSILGYFRYEAYRTDQLRNNLNNSILTLQESEDSSTKLIEQLSQKSEDLSLGLVNSSSGMLAFVFSGVMFAIAGAICLGIAFPIIVAYIRIWFQIPMKLRKLYALQKKQLAEVETLEALISDDLAIEIAQNEEILNWGDKNSLSQKQKELETQILEIKKNLHKIEVEIQYYELSMGYDKGRFAYLQEENKKKEEEEAKLAEIQQSIANKKNGSNAKKIANNTLNGTKKVLEDEIVAQEDETSKSEENTTETDATFLEVENNLTKISSKVRNKIRKK